MPWGQFGACGTTIIVGSVTAYKLNNLLWTTPTDITACASLLHGYWLPFDNARRKIDDRAGGSVNSTAGSPSN